MESYIGPAVASSVIVLAPFDVAGARRRSGREPRLRKTPKPASGWLRCNRIPADALETGPNRPVSFFGVQVETGQVARRLNRLRFPTRIRWLRFPQPRALPEVGRGCILPCGFST